MGTGRLLAYGVGLLLGIGLTAATGNGLLIFPFIGLLLLADFMGLFSTGSTRGQSPGRSSDYSISPAATKPTPPISNGEPDYSIGPGLAVVVVVGGVVVGFMVLAVFAVAILSLV